MMVNTSGHDTNRSAPDLVQMFLEAGCKLARPHTVIFSEIVKRTNGDPCRTGCAYFDFGKCPAFADLFPESSRARATMRKEDARNEKQFKRAEYGYAPPSKKPFKW